MKFFFFVIGMIIFGIPLAIWVQPLFILFCDWIGTNPGSMISMYVGGTILENLFHDYKEYRIKDEPPS